MGLFSIVGRAKGHNKELFFPGTVKSCSRTVDKEVLLADNLKLLLVPDILLLLTVDPVDLTFRSARRCAARRPSLIAIAVCCLDPLFCRCGSGTNPARPGVDIWRSGGSCSFVKMLEISASPEAYLSASC